MDPPSTDPFDKHPVSPTINTSPPRPDRPSRGRRTPTPDPVTPENAIRKGNRSFRRTPARIAAAAGGVESRAQQNSPTKKGKSVRGVRKTARSVPTAVHMAGDDPFGTSVDGPMVRGGDFLAEAQSLVPPMPDRASNFTKTLFSRAHSHQFIHPVDATGVQGKGYRDVATQVTDQEEERARSLALERRVIDLEQGYTEEGNEIVQLRSQLAILLAEPKPTSSKNFEFVAVKENGVGEGTERGSTRLAEAAEACRIALENQRNGSFERLKEMLDGGSAVAG